MNYLDLCQRLRQEMGASGSGPAAVTNQTGEYRRIVDWISSVYTEIQNRHDEWKWLRSSFTLNTVADDDTYAYGNATDVAAGTAITRLAHWWWMDQSFPMRIYKQSDGVGTEQYLTPVEWNLFRRLYKIGTQASGTPQHVTIDPQNNLVLGPKPDGIYVVSGDYQKSAQVLAANDDTPEMPSRFHLLIVSEALKRAGRYEAAQELFAGGDYESMPTLRALEADQLPPPELAEPMA